MPPRTRRHIVPLVSLACVAAWFVLVDPLLARGALGAPLAPSVWWSLDVAMAALGAGTAMLVYRRMREAAREAERSAEARQSVGSYERDLALSAAVDRILIEATSADELFDSFCRALVENGAAAAWVAIPRDDGRFAIGAHAGDDHGYLDELDVRWEAGHELGEGASGRAFRDGRSIVVDNVWAVPWLTAWRVQLRDCGFRSLAAIPMLAEARTLGVMTAYWRTTAPLSGRELASLERVAADLARGLLALNRRNEIAMSQGRLQAVLDGSPYAVLFLDFLDDPARIVYANAHVADMFGRSPEQLIGTSGLQLVPEEDRDVWREHGRAYREAPFNRGPSIGFKQRGLRADGSAFPAEVSVGSVVLDGRQHVVLTVVDLTQHEALIAELLAAQKHQVMGSLASILAHDFRNYATAIGGLAGLIADTMPAGDGRRDDLELIERTVGEATMLTTNVLAFARPQDARSVADVRDVFRDNLPILERVAGGSVRVRASYAGQLPPVQVHPSALGQVLVNLAANARDAMPDGGELSFDARPAESGILIRVRDTGTGMAPEVASRVFEPFFTTKGGAPGSSGGTGLGLSSVQTIVERAGGRIAVASQIGAGTTFEIMLPAAQAA